jgi:hypothetical protein
VAALELVHRVVLPAARPVIKFRAADDFGVASLDLVVDIERAAQGAAETTNDESVEMDPSAAAPQIAPPAQAVAEVTRLPLPLAEQPLASEHLPWTSTYALDLSPLALAPGDRLKLVIEATDYRGQEIGSQGGVKSMSEPRLLQIADENGVLAAIREHDQRSEAQLNELIRRQMSIGEQP